MSAFNIRATHPAGFRAGEWAEVRDLTWSNGRPCFVVRFIDDVEDTWPVYDPSDPYEFRLTGSGSGHYTVTVGSSNWRLEGTR